MNQLLNFSTKVLYPYWNNRLTVLMYHRVRHIVGVPFSEYQPTVSATPMQFEEQMAFIRDHFNPVSLGRLTGWLHGDTPLPNRPLLITFDDGYRDNFDIAFPILKKHGLPGVFFLATDYIGSGRPFDWDLTAYCFHNTRKREAKLPMAGLRIWKDERERENVMNEWIRLMLRQPDHLRREAVEGLLPALDISISHATFSDLCMSWDQVRNLAAAGMGVGSHTRNHVILDRLMPIQARDEMLESRRHIEKETGLSVNAFAYPNGVFNAELESLVDEAGYDVAFSTRQGPSTLTAVASRPLAIDRVAISRKDNMTRFLAKLAGLPRLKRRVKKDGLAWS
jgi:peptidoglycan/xylan/chitin deacetylase (PgdA/CDA1 family)